MFEKPVYNKIPCTGAQVIYLNMSRLDLHILKTVDRTLISYQNGMHCKLVNLGGYISWDGFQITFHSE